ncbi:MAG TPA: hypothetical protein VET66_07875 [Steroidobacteraceae bacterium]|nr:hypothetical protein [Steroidobacteraceae bacterium]
MHPDLDPERTLGRALRALPTAAARPYGFAEFERRAARRTAAREMAHGGHALAAAIAVVALTLVALSVRFAGPHAMLPLPEAAPPVAAVATPVARPDVAEHWLASLPNDPALVRVGSRAAVTGLEDRIAQVDDLLSVARAERAQPARLSTLQEQRRQLMGALVRVRYAETLAAATR